MTADLEAQVASILKIVFPLVPEAAVANLSRAEFSDWDSLKQIEIVTEIEETFDIELDDSSVMAIKDLKSIVQVVSSLL